MEETSKAKRKESILDVVITKEKINGKEFFVAQGVQLDVASQGLTLEEAIENIKDAAEIVLEDSKEKRTFMIEQESSEITPWLTGTGTLIPLSSFLYLSCLPLLTNLKPNLSRIFTTSFAVLGTIFPILF